MLSLIYISGLIAATAGAWWVTRILSEKKYSSHIQSLESKVRVTLGEASHLKEQVGVLKGEVISLQKSLSEERVSKQEAMVALSDSFHRALIGIGIMTFVTGGAMAGGLSWMAATWRTEAKLVKENTDQRIQFELTKLKLELLEKQFNQSETERTTSESSLQQEKIMRTVAETRLEALMGGLAMPQGLEGLPLEYLKMQNQSGGGSSKNSLPEDISLLKQAPFKP